MRDSPARITPDIPPGYPAPSGSGPILSCPNFVEGSPVPAYLKDRQGRYVFVNAATERHFNLPASAILGKTVLDLRPPDVARRMQEQDEAVWAEGRVIERRESFRVDDGSICHCVIYKFPVRDDRGEVLLGGLVIDVTERFLLEQRFRQAQKMESVGRLAGGVAHDFNNLLTVILGRCDLLCRCPAKECLDRDSIEEIRAAAQRAAGLTRQLLAFSRKQVLEPKIVDLNALLTETVRMLRRLIGEDVRLEIRTDPDLGRIHADPSQIEQIVMNLAVNARDAMPGGGTLTLRTGNTVLEEDFVRRHPGSRTGDFVVLTVADTGCGMDEETWKHLFEPFFTTKEAGKGTGLGLSTVYGIVKQSGGYIEAESRVRIGTVFRIYLPLVSGKAEAPVLSADGARDGDRGDATILLVEDDDGVRGLVRTILADRGYAVIEAEGGEAALRAADAHPGEIHLLITDAVMPGLDGISLARRLISKRPAMKSLYMSGYTDDVIVRLGVADGKLSYLAKPFAPDALVRKVVEILKTRSGRDRPDDLSCRNQ